VSQDVFDDEQLCAMRQAIDDIMKGSRLKRHEVAHTVFVVACESSEFDAAKLTTMALQSLARRGKPELVKS
jgi:hypothetical protein